MALDNVTLQSDVVGEVSLFCKTIFHRGKRLISAVVGAGNMHFINGGALGKLEEDERLAAAEAAFVTYV